MFKPNRNNRTGQIYPLLAVGAGFFFLLAAAMVDWIFIFAAHSRLIMAVDAAVIAATRELNTAATFSEQQANVNRIADMIFEANFPDGHMMSTSVTHDPPVLDIPGPGMRRVRVTAQAIVPTFFMRIAGKSEQQISATAEALRQDSNVMLVLDRSGSMNYFSGAPWAALNTAVPLFVDQFSLLHDRMGAVFYATNPFIDYSIQYPKGSGVDYQQDIKDLVNSHSPGGWTNISKALYLGYRELNDLNDLNALNVIVLFTDGRLTAISNQFPVNTAAGSGPFCGPNPPEPASPRWGTVVACPDIPGSLCTTTTPRGPYNVDVMGSSVVQGCFDSGGGTYTNGDASQVRDLVQEIPAAWQVAGYPDTFPISHGFNPNLPATPDLYDTDIITRVGENIALNIANQARQEGILIYTIGLGPDVSRPFMQVLANDPALVNDPAYSSFYNPNQPSGEYIFAEDSDALVQAFLRVATSVTHLTQ